MNIIFGYDIVTYNGPLPNCLNPKFYGTIYDASKFHYEKCRDYFMWKWGCDYAVFNSHNYDAISKNVSVHQIIEDRKSGVNYEWFYIVEPHSGLDLFFGDHLVHDEFILNFISKPALNEIINHNGKLLINYTVDGGLGINQKNFQKIIDFTRLNNIPDEKVYLIFSDFKLKENLNKLNVNYNVHNHDFYLKFKSHEFNKIINNIEPTNSTIVSVNDFETSIGKNKLNFLLLTRHWKRHRLFLLNKLHRLGLDDNLVSWEKSYYNQNYVNELLSYDNNIEFVELIKNTSRTIDVEDMVNLMGIGFENKEMYLNTYISIVTESIFFQHDVDFPTGFLSEKIWKPIGHCQPFILVAPSNSLKYIRERYGFKTFHPYIDETYDSIDDDMERLRFIEKEIEVFSNKTRDEKIQFLNDVKDICTFNQNKFLEYGKNTFGDSVIDEETTQIINFLNH
jgi:hypothetical protein